MVFHVCHKIKNLCKFLLILLLTKLFFWCKGYKSHITYLKYVNILYSTCFHTVLNKNKKSKIKHIDDSKKGTKYSFLIVIALNCWWFVWVDALILIYLNYCVLRSIIKLVFIVVDLVFGYIRKESSYMYKVMNSRF